jgi:CRP/FNR family cyclic AMP-dependent transcriptional regulator
VEAVGFLLDLLSDDDRRRLLATARRRRFKRGEVVFHEGDLGESLHIVVKGHVAIRTTTPMGDVAMLTVVGPGECFGEQALLSPDSRRTASAVSVEGAETQSITAEQFEELRADHPAVDRFLVQVMSAQVRRLSEHLLEALYVPADTRVLRRVLSLAALFGTDGELGGIPLTQDDIASMAGTSRPTANRVLRAAEDDGLLAVSRGRVEVLDAAGLERRSH